MKNYTCKLDASGWQSYTSMKGAEAVAADLSGTLTGLIRKAGEKLEANPDLSERKLAKRIRDKMNEHMDKVSKFGFADTEPSCVLVAEIEEAMGLKQYSLERY